MFRPAALLALVLTASLTAVAAPAPAWAHGQLAVSDPAHQSTITDARPRLALYFTEKPASNAFFSVTAPDGVRVDQGWAHGEPKQLETPVQELNLKDGKWEPVLYNTGFPAMVEVSHWPGKGVYTIRYVTVASDGDKVSGEVRFDFQGEPTAAPAGWQPPTNQPDMALTGEQPAVAASTAPAASKSPGRSRWPLFLGLATLAVALAAGLLTMRRRRSVGGR